MVRSLFLFAVTLLPACSSGKEAACETAIKATLRNPDSYKIIQIREEHGQGKAVSTYILSYEHRISDGKVIKNSQFCAYDNDSGKVYLNSV